MWKSEDINVIESTPLIDAADRIYIGTWGGYMRILRGCDGAVISEYYNSQGVSTTATLNNATGSLIYGGGDGYLRSFTPTCRWERYYERKKEKERIEMLFLDEEERKKKNRDVGLTCEKSNRYLNISSQVCNINAEAYERFITEQQQATTNISSEQVLSSSCKSCPCSMISIDAQHTGKSRFGVPRFFPETIVRGFENEEYLTQSALLERKKTVEQEVQEMQRVRTDLMETWGIMNNKAYWATRRSSKYERFSEQWQEVADHARSSLASIAANHAEPRTLRHDQLRALERLLRGEYEVCEKKDHHCKNMNGRWKDKVVKMVEDAIRNETERLKLEEEQYEINLRARLKREGRQRIADRNAELNSEKVDTSSDSDSSESTCKTTSDDVILNGDYEQENQQQQQQDKYVEYKDLLCTEISERKICRQRHNECMWKQGRCLYKESGCTDIHSCNYDEKAIHDDGSCVYPERNKDCDGNCIDNNDNGVCDHEEEEDKMKEEEDKEKNKEEDPADILPANLAFMAYRATKFENEAKRNATKFLNASRQQIMARDKFAKTNNLTAGGSYVVTHPSLEIQARDVVRWFYDSNETIYGTLSVSEDFTIYVGTKSGKMLAIDGHEGKLKWSFQSMNTIVSTPTITTYGTIIFGSWDGHVYALNSLDGTLQWKVPTHGAVSSSPVIYSETVYVGSGDGFLYALSVKDGTMLWKSNLNSGSLYSSPALSLNGEILYIASSKGSLFAVSTRTGGDVIWSSVLGTRIESSPVVSSELELIYIGTHDGTLFAIHASNGTTLWTFSVKNNRPIVSTPAISNMRRHIYVASKGFEVYCLDADTGKTRWQSNIGHSVDASLTLDRGDHVVLGTLQGAIITLRGDRGSLQFALGLPDQRIFSSVSIPRDGAMIFVTDKGKFYFVERMYPYF